jgi:hypothetical protein
MPSIRSLEQRREALLLQLRTIPNLMRGTVYVRQRKCGRAECACANAGGVRHKGWQLSVNMDGRTRTRHIRQEQLVEVTELTLNYQKLWRLVEKLTEVNILLLQERHGSSTGGKKTAEKG